MSQPARIFERADLSFASYADLSANFTPGDAVAALRDVGMSLKQAEAFANRYTIVDQYRNPTGLSATVFQGDAGERFLAVRGTDASSIGDLAADAYILQGWPRFLNAQFASLWQQVDIWISNGVLPERFTVSGHSLGGYLAAGIASSFSTHVDGLYLFNTPGTWGLGGNVLASLNAALGLTGPSASNVFNIRATPGISVAAALGLQPGPPIFIESEPNTNPLDPLGNHAIAPLTDALAIYSLFSKLESEQSAGTVEKIGEI